MRGNNNKQNKDAEDGVKHQKKDPFFSYFFILRDLSNCPQRTLMQRVMRSLLIIVKVVMITTIGKLNAMEVKIRMKMRVILMLQRMKIVTSIMKN